MGLLTGHAPLNNIVLSSKEHGRVVFFRAEYGSPYDNDFFFFYEIVQLQQLSSSFGGCSRASNGSVSD